MKQEKFIFKVELVEGEFKILIETEGITFQQALQGIQAIQEGFEGRSFRA